MTRLCRKNNSPNKGMVEGGVSIPTWTELCLDLVYDSFLALNSSNLPGRRLLLNTLNDAVRLHHDSSQNTSKKGRPSSEQGREDPRRSE